MKKQLLIAAVAATMGTAAMADISITGASKINYTNVDSDTNSADTNTFKHDMDFTLKGSNGGTGVVMTFSNAVASGTTANSGSTTVTAGIDGSLNSGTFTSPASVTTVSTTTGLTVEDVYMTSSIGDINVKMGQFQSTSDSNISDAVGSTRKSGRFSADTTIGGVKITFVDQNDSGEAIIFSGDIAGVSVSHKLGNKGAGANVAGSSDYTDTSISGSMNGVTAMYRSKDFDVNDSANGDLSTWQVSGDVNDFHLFAAGAESDSTTGTFNSEGVFGALAGTNNYSGVGVKTALAGNTVTVARVELNAISTGSNDDLTKIVVNRPLASGATFEATYTDIDYAGATVDKSTLDLELAVKF